MYVRSAVYNTIETPFVQHVGISDMGQSINIVGVKCVYIVVVSVVFPYWFLAVFKRFIVSDSMYTLTPS